MQTDWLLLTVTLVLALLGAVTIYSATFTQGSYYYERQLYWLVIGVVVMIPFVLFDYILLERFAYVIFGLSILTLIAVLIFGYEVGGAQRWLSLGIISFQPSELAKVAFTIALARRLSSKPTPPMGLDFKDLVTPLAILIIPFLLIAREPDLGTALVFVFVFTSMVLVVKVRLRVMIASVAAMAAMAPLAWLSLKEYQKARLMSFFDPSKDPLGMGYHLLQSKIAIGSGGVFGQGFTKGKQGSLMFLPEHHTDFIFPIIAEEWGFIGSMVLLALFLTYIMRGVNTALNSKDRFGFLLALGLTSLVFWHMAINLGMVTGLLPVVGVPLPFISYGGSFLLTVLISSAILINISMRRFILG